MWELDFLSGKGIPQQWSHCYKDPVSCAKGNSVHGGPKSRGSDANSRAEQADMEKVVSMHAPSRDKE